MSSENLLSGPLIKTISGGLVVVILGLICLASIKVNAQSEIEESFISLNTKFVVEQVPSDTILIRDVNTYQDLIHFLSVTENTVSIDSLVTAWTEERTLSDQQRAFVYYLAAKKSDMLGVQIKFLQRSLNLYERLEDLEGRVNCLSYFMILNYDTSYQGPPGMTTVEAHEEVKALMNQTSDPYTIRTAIRTSLDYAQLTYEYLGLEEIDYLYAKYEEISVGLPMDEEQLSTRSAFGIAYWWVGEKEQAVSLAQQNVDDTDTTDVRYFLELYNLGFLKNATGNPEEANRILIRSVKYWPEFTNTGQYSVAIYTVGFLSDFYKGKNMLDSALYYAKSEVALVHEKREFDIESERIESEFRFGLNRKERELEYLTSINEATRRQKNVLLIASICVTLLLFLTLFISRKLKHANVRLEQLLSSRDQLIAIIAHDLRTPLKTYQGLAESIDYLRQIKDWVRLKEVTRHIKQMGSDLDNMISNMLFWGLQQETTAFTSQESIDINEIVDQIKTPYQVIAKMKGVTLEFTVKDGHNGVGNSEAISVILNNLLDNALKYSKTGSSIRINLNLCANHLQIETLSSTTEEHFERLKEATGGQLSGSKMGLSKGGFGWLIIRKMVTQSKSQIELSGDHMECCLHIDLVL